MRFDVGNYLQACGEKYPDAHACPEIYGSYPNPLICTELIQNKITTPTLLIATRSDQLAPPSEIKTLNLALGGPFLRWW